MFVKKYIYFMACEFHSYSVGVEFPWQRPCQVGCLRGLAITSKHLWIHMALKKTPHTAI